MNRKPRVLITGASGLLGNEFIQRHRNKYHIHALTHSIQSLKSPEVDFIQIDFSKDWSVEILPKEIDYIIHLAQSPNFRDFPNSAMEVFNINLLSTVKLLDYAKNVGVRKFILASTGGIYGTSTSPISTNSEILSPSGLGHYFGSKLSAEIFANNYKPYFDVIINRIFFMYGPRQSTTMLIPRLIDSVKNGIPVQLAGKDGISINPVYVDDVADFFEIQLDDLGSHVYNIAGPETVSIRAITESIVHQFGGNAKYDFQPPAGNIVADATEFLNRLRNPAVKLSEGLKRF